LARRLPHGLQSEPWFKFRTVVRNGPTPGAWTSCARRRASSGRAASPPPACATSPSRPISHGHLYHYFRGKDELLFFCQDQSADRLLSALAAARRDRRPLPARLREMAIAHVLCLVDEGRGLGRASRVGRAAAASTRAHRRQRDRYERGVRALVVGGLRAGRSTPRTPTVATRASSGAELDRALVPP